VELKPNLSYFFRNAERDETAIACDVVRIQDV
jgi:hypothetical protein